MQLRKLQRGGAGRCSQDQEQDIEAQSLAYPYPQAHTSKERSKLQLGGAGRCSESGHRERKREMGEPAQRAARVAIEREREPSRAQPSPAEPSRAQPNATPSEGAKKNYYWSTRRRKEQPGTGKCSPSPTHPEGEKEIAAKEGAALALEKGKEHPGAAHPEGNK